MNKDDRNKILEMIKDKVSDEILDDVDDDGVFSLLAKAITGGKDEKRLTNEDKKLVEDAQKAYNIASNFIFGSSVLGGLVTLVTNGGKKLFYKKGDKVDQISEIEKTGINPNAKQKIIAGK